MLRKVGVAGSDPSKVRESRRPCPNLSIGLISRFRPNRGSMRVGALFGPAVFRRPGKATNSPTSAANVGSRQRLPKHSERSHAGGAQKKKWFACEPILSCQAPLPDESRLRARSVAARAGDETNGQAPPGAARFPSSQWIRTTSPSVATSPRTRYRRVRRNPDPSLRRGTRRWAGAHWPEGGTRGPSCHS